MTTLLATPGQSHEALEALASRRLCVGSGDFPLPYWTNLDANPACPADIHATVPPLPYADASLDEIFAGHLIEHLTPVEARECLEECRRVLVPGGRLGVVVPDTREVVKRYLRGDLDRIEFPQGTWRPIADLDTLCALFFYSTVQASPHRWSYDLKTLAAVLEASGFEVMGEIDRFADRRLGTGAWYQCGLDARRR